MLTQLINTLSRIRRSGHVGTPKACFRHLLWQCRKIFGLFPYVQKLSDSRIIAASSLCGVSALINCLGLYDFNNMNLFKLLLQKGGGNFFDIGANIGSYSLVAAEASRGSIYSFEPHPETFGNLCCNVKLNGYTNIHPIRCAVSDECGTVNLTSFPSSSTNFLVPSGSAYENVVSVLSISLDRFCLDRLVKPDFVKIDVEGHECSTLRGMSDSLADVKVLAIEINLLLQRAGKSETDVFRVLRECFLGPYYYNHRQLLFTHTAAGFPEDPIFLNRFYKDTLQELGFQFE